MVKIVALSGSPRAGATEYALQEALKTIEEPGKVEVEFLTIRGKKISPCTGCDYCKKNKTWCVIRDDFKELFDKILEADAVILGSPVYVFGAVPQITAFFSRMRPAHHTCPGILNNKLGASIAVGGTRNGGQEMTVNTLNNLMLSRGFNIVSNITGGYIGAFVWSKDQKAAGSQADEIGMNGVKSLAKKLAETAYIYKAGKEYLESGGE